MGIVAAFVGGIGGLCGIMGFITALDVVDFKLGNQFDVMFWFALATVLLLGSIALSLGRGSGGGGEGYD